MKIECEDTDEDYNDPIRLFESDEHAVYFGSRTHVPSVTKLDFSWQSEKVENNAVCRSRDDACKRPTEVTETSHSSCMSECDFPQSCVKLVDCGKFPWYFRKYTQQILNKTRLNLDSESDSEIDVVSIKDCHSDDCFIVEDLTDVSIKPQNDRPSNTEKTIQTKLKLSKNSIEKRRDTMKRKEEIEIQRALSLKNKSKIDFKRNQGLIGMKITRKIVKYMALDVTTRAANEVRVAEEKRNDKANETSINSTDKILSLIETQPILIPEHQRSSQFKRNIDPKRQIVSHESAKLTEDTASSEKVLVQFSLGNISEKLSDNIKKKTIPDSVFEDKIRSKVSNKSLLKHPENSVTIANEKESNSIYLNSSYKSLSHIKDVKRTNKYKNDQIKNQKNTNSALKELLILKSNKLDTKDLKCSKQTKFEGKDVKQNKVTKLSKKQHKGVEKLKRELKSPILPCNSLSKKPKVKHEMPPKCNKSDINLQISLQVDNLNKITNKFANENNYKIIQNNNITKKDIPKGTMNTTPSHVPVKQVLQGESYTLHDKNVRHGNNMRVLSTTATVTEVRCNDAYKTNFNTNNTSYITQTISVNHNDNTSIEKNLKSDTYKTKVKNSVNVVADASMSNFKTPIKNDKPTVSDKHVPTAISIAPISESKLANCDTNSRSQYPVQNSLSDKTSQGNISNNSNNVPVNILSKPNHQINLQVENLMHQRPATNMSIPIHTPTRVWNYRNPQPGYYKSAHSNRYQNYLPRSVNSFVPNRIPPPKDIEIICRQLSDPTSFRFAYKGWQSHNIAPPPPPPLNMPPRIISDRDVNQTSYCSYVNAPFYPSVVVSQKPQGTFNQNMNNISQSINNSIIGRNDDGLVKKINVTAVPVSKKDYIKEAMVKVVGGIKDTQIVSDAKPEVVATKSEMLEELDKLSFADDIRNDLKITYHDCLNGLKKASKFDMEILSKKPKKFETLRITVNDKSYHAKIEQSKGYSPPILPIPTYEKVLDEVVSDQISKNEKSKTTEVTKLNFKKEMIPITERDFSKRFKKKLSKEFNDKSHIERKDDAKKISLEEYKKRLFINNSKLDSNSNKKPCRDKSKTGGKRPYINYKYRENVDYSTETDLGYDSDSTVVL